MIIFILISSLVFVLFFLQIHNEVQLRRFEEIAQNKRKQFTQDMSLKHERFTQDTSSRSTELEKDIKFQHEDFKNQQQKFEVEIQQQRKEFIRQKISNEYKEGWLHATIFWFLVFVLAIYADDITNFFSIKKINYETNNEKYEGDFYSLNIDKKPAESSVKIMNIKEKYIPGISLPPDQYIIKIDYPNYASQCQIIVIEDSDVRKFITLEKSTEKSKKYTLTVKTKPPASKIQIIGIEQKYDSGIKLLIGQYVMKATLGGYFNNYQCITIKNQNVTIDDVILKKR